MGLSYIRATYGVPAKRGVRIAFTGDGARKTGVITSAHHGTIRVRGHGARKVVCLHPTWEVRYLGPGDIPSWASR